MFVVMFVVMFGVITRGITIITPHSTCEQEEIDCHDESVSEEDEERSSPLHLEALEVEVDRVEEEIESSGAAA